MLWLQIGIGATVTAIGTTNSNAARIAITVLGAVNTVMAGMLTFLKSRNQPNRALQFRNGLRDVYEDLWQVDAETGRDDFDVDKKVDHLWGRYKEVVADVSCLFLFVLSSALPCSALLSSLPHPALIWPVRH
jgi:cob(I)alamin adenosyltransferase